MNKVDEIKIVFARYIEHVRLMTGNRQFIQSKFMRETELEYIGKYIPYEYIAQDNEPKVYNSSFEADLMELLKKHNIVDVEGHISFPDEIDLQKNTSRTKTIEVEFTGTIS